MKLKFVEYDTGEIELLDEDPKTKMRYIAYWKDIRELKDSLSDLEGHF